PEDRRPARWLARPVAGAARHRGEPGRVPARPGPVLGVAEAVPGRGHDRLRGEPELAVQRRAVRRGAVVLEADAAPGVAGQPLPAGRHARPRAARARRPQRPAPPASTLPGAAVPGGSTSSR